MVEETGEGSVVHLRRGSKILLEGLRRKGGWWRGVIDLE